MTVDIERDETHIRNDTQMIRCWLVDADTRNLHSAMNPPPAESIPHSESGPCQRIESPGRVRLTRVPATPICALDVTVKP